MGLFGKKKKEIYAEHNFNPTKEIGNSLGGKLLIDYDSHQWTYKRIGFKCPIYKFSDIINYQFQEYGNQAVLKEKSKNKSFVENQSLNIVVQITVNNPDNPVLYIRLLGAAIGSAPKVSADSLAYRNAYTLGQRIVAELDMMTHLDSEIQSEQSYNQQPIVQQGGQQSNVSSASVVDQLKELRALHESGAITDEEYEMAKAKILG